MPHYGLRNIQAAPAGDAGAQPQFGIIAVGEEVLVEAADPSSIVLRYMAAHPSGQRLSSTSSYWP